MTEKNTNLRQAAMDMLQATKFRLTIHGDQVDAADGATYDLIDPATEAYLASAPAASVADVDRAVESAAKAFEPWRHLPLQTRVKYVRDAIDAIQEHSEELALLDALDSGNPIASMRIDAAIVREKIVAALDWATALRGEVVPGIPDHLHYTEYEPYGVVARITPFNHPLLVTAHSLIPLIVGNTVVVKTPDQAPLSGLRIGEILSDILPPGVFNVLSGIGPVAGDALVRHRKVRRIAFTGSVAIGQTILRSAAETGVKRVSLELGGKNALIIFPDADIPAAAAAAVRGMSFRTAGQSCASTSRLLVHESVVEEVIARVKADAESYQIGDPLDEETQMGTVISQAQYEKVLRYIELGQSQGGQLVTGGGRPNDAPEKGYYVSPTVLRNIEPDNQLAREEVFGPVLSVMTFRDEEEAIKIANDSDLGLTSSLWSGDLARAQRMARKIEAGYVWINTGPALYAGMPFGGFKNSGLERAEDIEELYSYMQVKSINVRLGS
ncbi:aldehyde dehydrogenase family protein [Nocardioides sp. AN3]